MNKLLYHLGNILLLTSLVGFVLIFYPFLAVYLSPPVIDAEIQIKKGMMITIPKIHAQAPIIPSVDPWNESIYNEALKKGVAQAQGTSLPGEKGTIFLFAHSSGNPWELTRMNTIFLRLGELQLGDKIDIVKDGEHFEYSVSDKKEVDPTEISYLLETKKDQLIIQTCTPIGTSLKRLLVFAEEKTNEHK